MAFVGAFSGAFCAVFTLAFEAGGFTTAFGAGFDFRAGVALFGVFTGGLEAPEEGLAGFPEGFRVVEDLGFFFNGTRVKPKTRARKDR